MSFYLLAGLGFVTSISFIFHKTYDQNYRFLTLQIKVELEVIVRDIKKREGTDSTHNMRATEKTINFRFDKLYYFEAKAYSLPHHGTTNWGLEIQDPRSIHTIRCIKKVVCTRMVYNLKRKICVLLLDYAGALNISFHLLIGLVLIFGIHICDAYVLFLGFAGFNVFGTKFFGITPKMHSFGKYSVLYKKKRTEILLVRFDEM
ncbi:hypothetical protein ACJX0J_040549, partial [Zea mays]